MLLGVNNAIVIGFIPSAQTAGLNNLKTNKAKHNYIIPFNEVNYTAETTLTKRKMKPYYENGEIRFVITLNFKAEILYGDKKTPYGLTDANIEEMQALLTEMVKKDADEAIEQAQKEYQTDYLQLDDAFRIKYPALFDEMDWQEEFLKSDITSEIKVNLETAAMMDYSGSEK
jgi:hypothetical protein